MKKIPSYKIIQEREEQILKVANEAGIRNQRAGYINRRASDGSLLEMIIDGSFTNNDVRLFYNENRVWETIYGFRDNPVAINICKIILQKAPRFIDDVSNVKAIGMMAYYYDERVNDIEDWTPRRKGLHVLLTEIIRFLYTKYEIPEFLYNGFTDGSPEQAYLAIHLGKGGSMKKFPFVPPLKLNNKAYHYLFEADASLNYYQGFRYAQILSMGGTKRLFDALMKSSLRTVPAESDDFWVTVIDLFIKAEMFDYKKIPEIIDYINHKKMNEGNTPFTMKFKTIAILLNQSEKWHHAMTLQRRALRAQNIGHRFNTYYSVKQPSFSWNKNLNIKDFHFVKPKTDSQYSILQLSSSDALYEEGVEMGHCVASYAKSCSTGIKQIFSLRGKELGEKSNKRLVTIEVSNYTVVQAKSKGNKAVSDEHAAIIRKWANEQNLKLAYGNIR